MAETTLPGAKVGPTFRHILVDQFRRLRDGDRWVCERTLCQLWHVMIYRRSVTRGVPGIQSYQLSNRDELA
ncbi:hypothetical protein DPMN_039534 [Dreissena polymorpha]|uniref:Uncharacterized protein n=1 Tax=Dreissena polymorpha TaxID=45954 RepID=A0A9D4CUZ6_DREPO|nr:hypothetical protein DPMN_039534 [Dreissena polymorpha]